MPESDRKRDDGNAGHVWVSPRNVEPEKSADILQATFKHYADVGLDHQRQAATTSNILLVVVGAIIALVGFDKEVCGVVDVGGAVAVIIIGAFGAVWSWKQHERYTYWKFIAEEYQKELVKIVPMLKTENKYKKHVEMVTAKDFGGFFARTLHVRYLWVFLHIIIVVIIGGGLFVYSTWHLTCPA